MKTVLDRFEGDFAVLVADDGEIINVPKKEMPPGVREGMTIIIGNGKYTVDAKSTIERHERIKTLFKDLFE